MRGQVLFPARPCAHCPANFLGSVEAFERNCEETIALLEDACSEMRQEIADMTSDYESDHDVEQRVRLSVMLIRLGKQSVEKMRDAMERFKTENPTFSQNLALISDADSFCVFLAKISPSADDLAVACYASKADGDGTELFANAESMANLINEMIDRFSESQIYLAHEHLQQLNQIRTVLTATLQRLNADAPN